MELFIQMGFLKYVEPIKVPSSVLCSFLLSQKKLSVTFAVWCVAVSPGYLEVEIADSSGLCFVFLFSSEKWSGVSFFINCYDISVEMDRVTQAQGQFITNLICTFVWPRTGSREKAAHLWPISNCSYTITIALFLWLIHG